MMKKLLLLIPVFAISAICSFAQVSENFTDGDITANPTWVTSNAADWVVTAGQLQSNNMVANSSFYLSTPSTLATTAQWEFYANLKFATSSANYVDVFLIASAADLSATATSGFFVRIGNTTDEISLYRKDGATITKIIDGADITTNASNNTIRIKVVRTAANLWILSRDLAGGTSYTVEGTATDAAYATSNSFGIFVKQSTVASFAQRHFFDDIVVQAYVPDVTAPTIVSSTVVSSTAVDVLFNEALDPTTAATITNYSVNNSIGNPTTAILDGSNSALVHLNFAGSFPDGVANQVTVNGVKDISNNAISGGTSSFTYFAPYTPKQYDVVIDEIMADPDPVVTLPNKEWIELRNTSASAINLQGWKIGTATTPSGDMPNYTLLPDSFVIVCSSGTVAEMLQYGHVIAVTSFPSLSNDGAALVLTSNDGTAIHSVNYSSSWYQNTVKKNGGWTLEMIDTKNPCSGFSNWKASNDPKGGTPGAKNSVDAVNVDNTAPQLLRAYANDANTITLYFNEPVDGVSAANTANYTVSDGVGTPVTAAAISPTFDKVVLSLSTALAANQVYTVTVTSAITDCVGNQIGTKKSAKVGLTSVPDSFDVVINEILFNPPTNGVDYVELYNRSNKNIDLAQLYISNDTADIGTQASKDHYLLFPGDYVVLTSDPTSVMAKYVAQNPDAFSIVTLPSFSDAEGTVVLFSSSAALVDKVAYSEKWHFKLIDNREGVSLERINANDTTFDDPMTPTVDEQSLNWHSAAKSVGYGTPTYKNSQYRIDQEVQGDMSIEPKVFSPDNDGFDDYATLSYSFPSPGYVANITIFDASGRPVRYLQKNALLGITGLFRWDGLGDKNQQLAVGIYVIYTEVFNLQGKKKTFKTPIVLARRN